MTPQPTPPANSHRLLDRIEAVEREVADLRGKVAREAAE